MSERLYPSIPEATPQELASNLENIYRDALNGELGPARQSSITAIAAHYARLAADLAEATELVRRRLVRNSLTDCQAFWDSDAKKFLDRMGVDAIADETSPKDTP